MRLPMMAKRTHPPTTAPIAAASDDDDDDDDVAISEGQVVGSEFAEDGI